MSSPVPKHRQEDIQVKIPALVHLTRLGYRYLPRSGVRRDRDTNILIDIFRESLSRINGKSLSDEAYSSFLSEIRESLSQDDLGERFFDGLRNSWRGLRLIDFDNPENNAFHVMTELPCSSGKNRFRPDITLLVNGLPLAFIEVKKPSPRGDVRSEYSRMYNRARNRELRRFINETQIMVFSNDEEYEEDALLPLKGVFYATTAYEDFVFNSFEEKEKEIYQRIFPVDPDEEALILRDNRLEFLSGTGDYLSSLSPLTPTHRTLSSLFQVSRLLFFLRYGITYLEREEAGGFRKTTKQILRYPQLFTASLLDRHLEEKEPRDPDEPGEARIFRVHGGGKAAIASLQIRYLSDYFSRMNSPVLFFYLADQPDRLSQVRKEFISRGFRVQETGSGDVFSQAILRENSWTRPPMPLITLVDIREFAENPLPDISREAVSARHVYFLDELDGKYDGERSFLTRLRAADKEAVMIAFSFLPAPSLPSENTSLLFASI